MINRAVLITFFASWCPPCRTEFEYLNLLREEYTRDELTIVAINVFESDFAGTGPGLSHFLKDAAPRFHVVTGNDETRRRFGNVDRIPTLFIFDSKGSSVKHFIHKRGAKKTTAGPEELRDAIEEAIR